MVAPFFLIFSPLAGLFFRPPSILHYNLQLVKLRNTVLLLTAR